MKFPFFHKKEKRSNVGILLNDPGDNGFFVSGYTTLDKCPEVMTACRRIAELIGSITVHLMKNGESGDERIVNELSKFIDIRPMPNLTRSAWMESVVMNLLLYGRGNSVVLPRTRNGYFESLEPISPMRISFLPTPGSYKDYKILIDGKAFEPSELLHFTYNPSNLYPWKGTGVQVSLRDVAHNLKQAAATERGFMESKWKPSIIMSVDAMTGDFATKEGREKILKNYVDTDRVGQPWILPAEQFKIEQIRPLSLADLAINDTVEIDKRMVAAVLGVPPFLLGVGEYKKEAWNSFIQSTIRTLCVSIAQEMTSKLILSPDWYLKFNFLSLMDWDIKQVYDVFGGLSDRGIVTGNEVRDRMGMSPLDGLDELRILENYIPTDMIGAQKKLVQGKEGE